MQQSEAHLEADEAPLTLCYNIRDSLYVPIPSFLCSAALWLLCTQVFHNRLVTRQYTWSLKSPIYIMHIMAL